MLTSWKSIALGFNDLVSKEPYHKRSIIGNRRKIMILFEQIHWHSVNYVSHGFMHILKDQKIFGF